MTLSAAKLGPLMRFRRFRISGSYIFQEKRRGNHVNHLEDCAHEWLKGFLKPISDACIYLPEREIAFLTALLLAHLETPGSKNYHRSSHGA
jgi:hypothetical protein